MSLTVPFADYEAFMKATPFSPSAAKGGRFSAALSPVTEGLVRVVFHIGVAATSFIPSSALALPQPIPVQVRPVQAAARPIASSKAMATRLIKELGLPITALSDVLDVERKTIYDWLNKGAEAQDRTAERLRVLDEAFEGERDGSLHFVHRFWNRSASGGASLRDVLMAETLDKERIRAAIDALRPAVEDAMASAQTSKQLQSRRVHPSESMSDYLEAG